MRMTGKNIKIYSGDKKIRALQEEKVVRQTMSDRGKRSIFMDVKKSCPLSKSL